MAGVIKGMIDSIVAQRAKGNNAIAILTVTRLTLKGVDPDRYLATSPDDPAIIAKLKTIAGDMGVRV